MSEPWVKRAYDPSADEAMVVSHWLILASRTRRAKRLGANRDGTVEQATFTSAYRPVVEALVRGSSVELVVDRALASSIWGFVCFSPSNASVRAQPQAGQRTQRDNGDMIHMLCVKRHCIEAGFGLDLAKALLGERLDKSCMYTQELTQLEPNGNGYVGIARPNWWIPDFTYVPTMLARAA